MRDQREENKKKLTNVEEEETHLSLLFFFSERPGFINVISIDFGHCVRMEDFEVKI